MVLLYAGALQWVFGSGTAGHSLLSFGDSRGRFAQTCIGQTQAAMQLRLGKRTRRDLLELALNILRRFLVSRACRGDIAGPLLSQTQKKFVVVAWLAAFGFGSHCTRAYLYGRG